MKVRVAGGATLLVLALTGCSALDSVIAPQGIRTDVTMTPAEARADLATRSDALVELLGGQWENHDNFIAAGCGEDEKGFYYYGSRRRSVPIPDPAAVAAQVESWWLERGYTVEHAQFRDDHLLEGVSPTGLTINLTLSSRHTDFSTDGPCILGDWYEISLEDGRNHRNDFPRTPTPTPVPAPPSPAPAP